MTLFPHIATRTVSFCLFLPVQQEFCFPGEPCFFSSCLFLLVSLSATASGHFAGDLCSEQLSGVLATEGHPLTVAFMFSFFLSGPVSFINPALLSCAYLHGVLGSYVQSSSTVERPLWAWGHQMPPGVWKPGNRWGIGCAGVISAPRGRWPCLETVPVVTVWEGAAKHPGTYRTAQNVTRTEVEGPSQVLAQSAGWQLTRGLPDT